MRHFLTTVGVTAVLASSVAAHHDVAGRAHPATATVQLTQAVIAGGQPLRPGSYEIVVLDQATDGAQRLVDILHDGKVVAHETAEMFPVAEHPVGTAGAGAASGSTGGTAPRAVVQTLRGGDFVRIALNGGGARYLIHLPTRSQANNPAPQPQAPSRIERGTDPPPNAPSTGAQPLSLP